MSRVFVTGDTHIPIDVKKLNSDNFLEGKELTKDDYVIVAGDFGVLWSYKESGSSVESNPEDLCWTNEELYWKKWFEEKPWTTLFIDGNHENHARLDSYPVSEWHGGKAHIITPSIIHLMRGQIYDIAGHTFFTFGGGKSIDRGAAVGQEERDRGKVWWDREIPSEEEFAEGMDNLERRDYKVDYVITHSLPVSILREMRMLGGGPLSIYFDELIKNGIQFKRWYSGHYHQDITDGKWTLIFNRVAEVLDI